MKLVVHRLAEAEIASAAKHYYAIHPTLASSFYAAMLAAKQSIVEQPEAWPLAGWGARKRSLDRFPYRMVYLTRDDTLHVIAFMHAHRRPGYWRRRKPVP